LDQVIGFVRILGLVTTKIKECLTPFLVNAGKDGLVANVLIHGKRLGTYKITKKTT
jgi:hypothetical protein